MIDHFTLLPGAEVISADVDGRREHAQFGVPPCIKLWFQRRLAPPTTFVLPDRFFHRGVVQVAVEFFFYYFLFAMGKAFGRLPEHQRLVVIGTRDQLARCRRMLTVSLFGFEEAEMRSWNDPDGAPLGDDEIAFIRDCQVFLSPKKAGFDAVRRFIAENPDPAAWKAPADAPALLRGFIEQYAGGEPRVEAYAFCRIQVDDAIEWRAFESEQAELFPGVRVERRGGGRFRVTAGDEVIDVSTEFDEDQAPWLVTLPPAAESVSSDVFRVLCLGADPGFEMEHPTTGFAICINGSWAVIDAPLCASYLLAQHGIDPADVRIVFETHGHEDHMGSGIHFMLECITSGRPYTYVAAEPVFRTCVVKVAAILGVSEDEARSMLTGRGAQAKGAPARVRRVSPRTPARLLGATWHFVWMVHPVPTTGFRIELEHEGRRYVLSYSSDTAPLSGAQGLEAMRAEGFLAPDADPYAPLLQGDEDLVFFEAGGTAGDPIHFNANDWEAMCQARGVHPTVVFMHAHPMPSRLRTYPLARPGMSWTLASRAPLAPALFLKLVKSLRFFSLHDDEYWLWMFLSQGRLQSYYPRATVLAEGTADDSWFVVLQGQAEVTVGGEVAGVLGSSAFFGDPGVDNGHAFGLRALSHLDVWRVPGEVFREFVMSNGLFDFFAQLWSNVGWLQRSRLFLGFPHQVLASLSRRAERREYKAGEPLMLRGESGREMYVVLEGEVEISSREGRAPLVCGPGELLGEYGVLVPGAQRSATVRAVTDVRVLVLTRDIIDDIVAGQIPLHLRLVDLLEDRGLPLPRG